MKNFLRVCRLKVRRRVASRKASQLRVELLDLESRLYKLRLLDASLRSELEAAQIEVACSLARSFEAYERNEPLLEELQSLERDAKRSSSNYSFMCLPDDAKQMKQIEMSLAWQQEYYVKEMYLLDEVLEEDEQVVQMALHQVEVNEPKLRQLHCRCEELRLAVQIYQMRVELLDREIAGDAKG